MDRRTLLRGVVQAISAIVCGGTLARTTVVEYRPIVSSFANSGYIGEIGLEAIMPLGQSVSGGIGPGLNFSDRKVIGEALKSITREFASAIAPRVP